MPVVCLFTRAWLCKIKSLTNVGVGWDQAGCGKKETELRKSDVSQDEWRSFYHGTSHSNRDMTGSESERSSQRLKKREVVWSLVVNTQSEGGFIVPVSLFPFLIIRRFPFWFSISQY